MTLPVANPFSTQFTRPGAVPFLYPTGLSRETLIERLAAANWQAQILGQHGAGKTTLALDLLEALSQHFDRILRITVRQPSVLKLAIDQSVELDRGERSGRLLILIDGVERLAHFHRWALKRVCQRKGIGLLATVHRQTGWLPTIATLETEFNTFERIANQLLVGSETFLSPTVFRQEFENAKGNCREAFMGLYDRFEAAAPVQACAV